MRTKIIKCKRCESKNTYVLVDGTIVCRGCGYKTKSANLDLIEPLTKEDKEE